MAVGLYCALIFGLSSLSRPLPFLAPAFTPPDWVLHLGEYGILGALLADALGVTFQFPSRFLLLLTAGLLGTLYGLSDEWHQSFVPPREASLRDLVVDALGIFLGAIVWLSYRHPERSEGSRF